MKTEDILEQAAATYRERNAVYRDNWAHMGPAMTGLFPRGIELKTEEDFIRFHFVMLMVVKLTRYAECWKEGHPDSLRDTAVYAAMLESYDDKVFGFHPDYHAPTPNPSAEILTHLVRQIEINHFEDDHGHLAINLQPYREAKELLAKLNCRICDWPISSGSCTPELCHYAPTEGTAEYHRIAKRRKDLGL